MNQLKMDVTNAGKIIPSLIEGDDGEAMAETEQNEAPSLQDEPRISGDAGWFVAVVRCNLERRIANAIASFFKSRNIWFESWVPVQKVAYIDKRTNKRKFKEKVFLSTFIFCHVSRKHLDDIRFRSDVYKMLTMPGHREIYQISDNEFYNYRRIVENPDQPAVPCSGPLKKGQKVRITEGKMAGLEAYVQRVSGKKALIGNEIKFISGATIEIDRSFLEVVDETKL